MVILLVLFGVSFSDVKDVIVSAYTWHDPSMLLVPFGVRISDAKDSTPVYLLSVDVMEFSDLSSPHNIAILLKI
jgi:hypothetical protein